MSIDISEGTKLSLLKEALENGTIIVDSVLNTIMATKREQVKKLHAYANYRSIS